MTNTSSTAGANVFSLRSNGLRNVTSGTETKGVNQPPSGGDGGGMESRVTRLEERVKHIGTNISEVKSDIGNIRSMGVALFVALFVAFFGALVMLYNNLNKSSSELTEKISELNTEILQEISKITTDVSVLDEKTKRIPVQLETLQSSIDDLVKTPLLQTGKSQPSPDK